MSTVAFASNLEGALWWFEFGYRVIPLVPGQKRPATAYHPWLDELSVEAVRQHWTRHPDHEVGAVLDDTQLVLDADSPEADEALSRIELQFGVVPSLVIKTRRGHHHHYRLTKGTFAKADSHHTETFADRIDVRAGRNSVLLTPSQDKSVDRLEARHRDDMSRVHQDFVDAVFQHNGRAAPRPAPDVPEERPAVTTDATTLSELLSHIDPDCGYQDWLNVLMAVFHETAGSDNGLELADAWSKKAGSYKGRADIEAKWRSFRGDVANPITIATLIARARNAGANVSTIMQDDFKPCTTVVTEAPATTAPSGKDSPFRKYSLIGQAAKYEGLAQAATPLLGDVCLRGEATVFYAKHNTGKTLLCLHMVSEAVEQNRIAAGDVYFINADDSSAGIAAKLGLLDEIGAHTLVPGQRGFKAEHLEQLLLDAVRNDAARGTLVVIDTLKKFVDLMHKKQASDFANVCRQFVAAGGSVLGLAHTNKRKSDDGKAVHAGTSDILDDFDAGYIIDEVPLVGNAGEKFVEFTRLKGRGGGVQSVAYAYAAEDHVSYAERLASVRLVEQADLEGIKRTEEERSDAEIIAVVITCITEGVNAKMALRNAVSDRAKISRRAATKIIERYTGEEPGKHHWSFARTAHNKMMFTLLRNAGGLDGEVTPPGG
ncbi:PriCT-2 domain-containing protein [Sphingomonas sp. AR_OL41]|uniref:PriCT-2 domain-containing protein n=1 Tax=Sphingomonas sp. AR_OL41 TaxID=3042729 RepID=UPI0024816CFA|nr:PriCT-2 domain-containing protein [Sphingomonas sp. AR_OL41]MDH7973533.1 PriCT-2 domain-containing protein [Sphingomonas sp. AR_OL41]